MFKQELLQSGDLILFHTRGFSIISMAIRELTQSYWNHIGMYYEDVFRKRFVIEALGGGVVKTPIEKYLNNEKYVFKATRLRQSAFKDEAEYSQGILTVIERMQDKVGSKYDWWAIVGLGFKYIFKGSYKKAREYVPIGNPLQSRDKFFCSELVCECCYKISSIIAYLFQGSTKQACDTTTPKDIGKSQWVEFVTGEHKI